MRCIHCRAAMQKGVAPFHVGRKVYHLTLDAVLAWACEQCGEAYFEEREIDTIQGLVSSLEEKVHALALRAWSVRRDIRS